jgi:hypothetical protein
MKWSPKPPTTPGAYWWRAGKGRTHRIAMVEKNGPGLWVHGYGTGDNWVGKIGGEFAGPIGEPEEN